MIYTSNADKDDLTMLVSAFRNGEEAAFSQLYQKISSKLYNYAVVMTGDPVEAEDLLQDTLIEIIKSIGNLQDTSAFTSWSIGIMRNVYRHKLRKNRDIIVQDEEELNVFDNIVDEDMSVRPDTALEDESVGLIVKGEIDKLPEAQRVTMIAHYYDNLSVHDISEMMGVSESTTKSRLFAGRKAMRRGIEKYEQSTGIKLHEITPASYILWLMRYLSDSLGADEQAVLQSILEKVVEETGISAEVPSEPGVPTEQAPEEVPEQPPEEAPEEALEQPTEQPTEQALEEAPEEAPEQPIEQAPEEAPEEAPEQPTEQAPEEVSEEAPEQPTEQVPEEAPEEAPEQPTEQETEQATEEVSEEAPEQPTEQAPEEASEEALEQPTEQETEQAPEEAPEEAPEQPTEQAPEQPTERPIEQTPEEAPEEAPEQPTEQVPEQVSEEAPEQPTEQVPEEAPDEMPEEAPEEVPEQSFDESFEQAPEEEPELREANPEKKPHNNKQGNSSSKENQTARQRERHNQAEAEDARAREKARRIKRSKKRSFKLNLIAAAAGFVVVAGIVTMIALRGLGPFIPSLFRTAQEGVLKTSVEEGDYRGAYLSALSLYEEEIRNYKWQYDYYGNGSEAADSKPTALIDIDGDDVPELFFMSTVNSDPEGNWHSADLHIFTYKNRKLQEVEYVFDYPTMHTPEYYDSRSEHYNSGHNDRMVHFCTWEPNTTFAVFTGKAAGTLYILATDTSSETSDLRMEKYSMKTDAKCSCLEAVQHTYITSTEAEGEITSEDPAKEMESAIADTGAIVLYGGNIGTPQEYTEDFVQDPGKYGWQNINEEGVNIAPEAFSGCKSMSYDEIVEVLQKNREKDSSKDAGDFANISRSGDIQQAGSRLFKYDLDHGVLKHIKIGDTSVREFDMNNVGSLGSLFTDGNVMLYFKYAEDANRFSLTKFGFDDQEEISLREFTAVPDPNSGYYIGAVYDGNAYIGYTDGSNNQLWVCDIEKGELFDVKEHLFITQSSGKYVLTMPESTLSAETISQGDIYELKGTTLKHVKDLGKQVSAVRDVINGDFYYSVYKDDSRQDITLYKCNADGSKNTKLANIKSTEASISVNQFHPTYCTAYTNGVKIRYDYKTKMHKVLE